MTAIFQFDLGLRTDPKVAWVARELRVSPTHLRGCLGDLWAWAFESCPSGVFTGETAPDTIAQAAGWTGPPALFVKKLAELAVVEFSPVNHTWTLKDWKTRYQAYRALRGEVLKRRREVAERVRRHRRRQKEYALLRSIRSVRRTFMAQEAPPRFYLRKPPRKKEV